MTSPQHPPDATRPQLVDVRVQAAIENLQAGRSVEDDSGIEFKAEWPAEPLKAARQIAGAANALRGLPLLYVIGVDDKSGLITVPDKREPFEWYAQVARPFDQVAPELLRAQTVFVGDKQESVQVLVFDTSNFPYVVNANNRREVPIRVGAGTESARRNQLLRLLDPTTRAPAMTITEAGADVVWQDTPLPPQQGRGDRDLSIDIVIRGRVLIEHFGPTPTSLPVRDMHARLTCGNFETRPQVEVRNFGDHGFAVFRPMGEAPPPPPVPPPFGVHALNQHVIATAPGEFEFFAATYLREQNEFDWIRPLHGRFLKSDDMRLDLILRVVGVDSQARLSVDLTRSEPPSEVQVNASQHGEIHYQPLGSWILQPPVQDPWGLR